MMMPMVHEHVHQRARQQHEEWQIAHYVRSVARGDQCCADCNNDDAKD
jgi:hypothetical protein